MRAYRIDEPNGGSKRDGSNRDRRVGAPRHSSHLVWEVDNLGTASVSNLPERHGAVLRPCEKPSARGVNRKTRHPRRVPTVPERRDVCVWGGLAG
jgi:hypothetical protein